MAITLFAIVAVASVTAFAYSTLKRSNVVREAAPSKSTHVRTHVPDDRC